MSELREKLNDANWTYALMSHIAQTVDDSWSTDADYVGKEIVELALVNKDAKYMLELVVGESLEDIITETDERFAELEDEAV